MLITGNDVTIDFRVNNWSFQKFDSFWNILADYIKDKTTVDDRRHSNVVAVIYMGLAPSYVNLHQTYVIIAKDSLSVTDITVYTWFMLEFGPSYRTQSK